MISSLRLRSLSLFITAANFYRVTAQTQLLPPYMPSHEEIIARYKAVATKDSTVKNTIYKATIDAHWLPGSNAFWYRNILHDSTTEYLLVNAANGSRRKAFNEAALATALSKMSIK